ncbi:MAG: acyltransferase, partial [Muribaculaceae bacterium]|nr:acyltransferase [Muribaculaceae bacterium]
AVSFCVQGSKQWDGTSVSLLMVVLALCFNVFMLPVYPGAGAEVRGNGEMFPLNGPNWSLFFEYLANILYAVFIRRFSTAWLRVLTIVSGVVFACMAIMNFSGFYHMGVGWTLADYGFWGGFTRLMFSFTAGMYMSRTIRPRVIKHAFWICSVLLIVFLAVPYVGNESYPWLNGLYDTVCVMVVFPTVLYIGASAHKSSVGKTSNFLGRISYPLYAIHYPIMYLFYAWLWSNSLSFSETWHVGVAIFFGCIILAYLIVRYYDEPVRQWLTRRFK